MLREIEEDKSVLSKSQQKKRIRQEKYLIKKAYQKKIKKEKKKIKQAQKVLCEKGKLLKDVPDERKTENCFMNENKKRGRIKNKQDFFNKCEKNPCVVIDCDFDDYHSLKDLSSLTQQLMYTYGVNRQSENPLRLKIVGLSEKFFDMLQRISGIDDWLCTLSKDALEFFFDLTNLSDTERNKFVYLTADASTALTSLNQDHTYIVGGIVDRNKEKGLTLAKAQHLGLRTARLPLNDYCHLSGSKVLTVNQVFQLLSVFYCTQNWKEAIEESVPVRKMTLLPTS